MTSNSYRGVFTIPSTPFRETGEIDILSFQRMIDFCIEGGSHGLVYPVNASEFTALSDAERLELSEVLVKQNAGQLPVIIGVAGVAREVAEGFAKHARDIGAHGVIAMPPYIHHISESLVSEYYQTISDAAQIPVFIQNNMPPIGSNLSADFLLKLCREIEHVDYIKEETLPSTVKLTAVVEGNDGSCKGVFGGAGGRYLIEEYRRGSAGQMPASHVVDVVVALWAALEAGDEERSTYIYKEMAPLFLFEHQLPGCYKEVLYRRGIIDCPLKRNGKMPLDDISSKYLDEILAQLEPLMTWKK